MDIRDLKRTWSNVCYNAKQITPLNIGVELSQYEIILKLTNTINDAISLLDNLINQTEENSDNIVTLKNQIDNTITPLLNELNAKSSMFELQITGIYGNLSRIDGVLNAIDLVSNYNSYEESLNFSVTKGDE